MKKSNKKPDNIKHNPVAKYMNIFNKCKVHKNKKHGLDDKHKHRRDYVDIEQE